MSARPNLKIEIRTATGFQIEYDLVSDNYLRTFGKSVDDIKDVRWADHFPGSIYTELGLAGPHHPLIGSGSGHFCFKDGSCGEVSEIFYQDFNEKNDHFAGKEHWNHERRYAMTSWSEPRMEKHPNEAHIIDKAEWLELKVSNSKGDLVVKRAPWEAKFGHA